MPDEQNAQQKPEGPARNINQTRRMEAAARHAEALRLRLAGATYTDIARTLGWIGKDGIPLKGSAYNACMKEVGRLVTEPAEHYRKLELLRIERAQLAIWAQVIAGNFGAVDRFVRLSERRSKLLGLDMPIKIAPTDPSGEKAYDPLHVYVPANNREST